MPAFPPPACDLRREHAAALENGRRISGGSGLITSCSAPGLPVSCSIACRRASTATGENTWRTPPPYGCTTIRCSESGCDAGTHPASWCEDRRRTYLAGSGKASIRRSMLPNRRSVRWLGNMRNNEPDLCQGWRAGPACLTVASP